MPLPTATWLSGPYTPNGTATRFPFQFVALSPDEVRVYVVDSNGVETDLSNYAVDGILDTSGGAAVFTTAPDYPGQLLYVQADPTFTQPQDFQNQGEFNPTELNTGLDRAALRDIYLLARDSVTRAGLNSLNARVVALEGGTVVGSPLPGGGGMGGPVSWQSITGKPSEFNPAPHAHTQTDIGGLANSFAAKADLDLENVDNADFLAKAQEAGVTGGGGGGTLPPSLSQFCAVGQPLDGGGTNYVNNDIAFAAAEASAETAIYLPLGVFRTTRTEGQLTKRYVGVGKIKAGLDGTPTTWDGAIRPPRFSFAKDLPTLSSVQGKAGWFDGDQRFGNGGSWHILGAAIRTYNVNQRYFEAALIPEHAWFDVGSGHSGLSSRLQNQVNAGATSMTLWADAANFLNGKQFVFCVDQDGDAVGGQVYTVSAPPVGSVVNFTPAATQTIPAGYAVRVGKRTWNGRNYRFIRALEGAGGDVYGDIVRLTQAYQPWAGQKHWVNSGTVGAYGGDMNFLAGSSGSYGTGWEFQYIDQGNDVSVQGHVDSFKRDNDTGSRGAVWLAYNVQSSGLKPIDAVMTVNGKARTVLDTTGADLSTFLSAGDNYNIAINMALGHRIAFNSRRLPGTRSADPNGYYYGPFFGSTPGDMFLDAGTDGTGDYIEMWYNRAAPNNARFRLRPNGAFFNVGLKSSTFISAGTDLILGEALAPNFDGALSWGPGTGNFIRFNKATSQFDFYVNFSKIASIAAGGTITP